MKNAVRHLVHGFISWYLNRVGRAFHVHPYGNLGRYVVIMTEGQYHEFREKVSWPSEKAVEHSVQRTGGVEIDWSGDAGGVGWDGTDNA